MAGGSGGRAQGRVAALRAAVREVAAAPASRSVSPFESGFVNMPVRMPVLALLIAVVITTTTVARSAPSVSGAQDAASATAPTRSVLVVLRDQLDTRPLEADAAMERLPKVLRGLAVHEALVERARLGQSDLARWLDARGLEYRSFWITNMIRVEASAEAVRELSARPDVDRVVEDSPLQVERMLRSEARSAERRLIEWNVDLIGAPAVWSTGVTGTGVTIGLIDTGVRWDHAALKQQYRGWDGASADHDYHWHDAVTSGGGVCGPSTNAPCDPLGHGTLVLGCAVGDDGGSNRIGVAPDARWIGCRAWDESVGTSLSLVADCLQWMLAPTDLTGSNADPTQAPDVINNSWVCEPSEGCADPLVLSTAVQNLRAAGIVVVAGAGNDGSACSSLIYPPAIYEESFAIGASNIDDALSFFSSRGPVTVDGSNRLKPDVVAPGQNIRSSSFDGGYENGWSGTSMASPHVAGAIALMISANTELRGQVQAIEDILEDTAVPITVAQTCGGIPGSVFPNPMVGHGRIDAFAAYLEALDFTASDVVADPFPTDGAASGAMGLRVHPNPARLATSFELHLEYAGVVDVDIYDASGRHVLAPWKETVLGAGRHTFDWDLRDARGRAAVSGVYFVRARQRPDDRVPGVTRTVRVALARP